LTAKRLLEHPEFGLRTVGFLDKTPLQLNASTQLPAGASWDLEENRAREPGQQVIFTFSTAPHDVLLGLMIAATSSDLGFSDSALFEKMPARLSIDTSVVCR